MRGSRRLEWIIVPLLFSLALAWIYRDLWHRHGIATAFGWDANGNYSPQLSFMSDDLATGHFARWNPYDKGGFAMIGEPSFDRYNPFNWLWMITGALLGSPWWLIHAKLLGVLLASACMMHLFLRTRGLSPLAALVGGVALISSTPLLLHKASCVIWPMVWIPLAWIAIDRLVERPSLRRGILLGGALAMIGTAGSPPGTFYSALLVGSYGAWRIVPSMWSSWRHRASRDALRLAGLLAVAFALAGAIVAITIVPMHDSIATSIRNGEDGGSFALENGDGPTDMPASILPAMLVPASGAMELYVGVLVLIFAVGGVIAQPRRDNGIGIVLLVVGMIAISFSFGKHSSLLPFLVKHLPVFGRLRAPLRYRLVLAWALAPLAAMATATVTSPDLTRAAKFRWLATVAVMSIVAVWLWATHHAPPFPAGPRPGWWSLIFISIAIVMAVVSSFANGRATAFALPLLLALVIVNDAPNFLHTPTSPPAADPRRYHDHDDELIAKLGDVQEQWRLWDEFSFADCVGLRKRVRDMRGYPAVEQLAMQRYRDMLKLAKSDPGVLADFNVRWLLQQPHYRVGTAANFVTDQTKGGAYVARPAIGPKVFEAVSPAPLIAWYGGARLVPTADALRTLRAVAPTATSPQRALAVLEPDDARRLPWSTVSALLLGAAAPPPSVNGTLISYGTDEIVADIDAPAAGIVVLNEFSYPGWTVTVDARAATITRANYLLRAVAVAPGHHRLVWRFEPAGFTATAIACVLGWLLVLGAIFWPRSARDKFSAGAF